MENEKRDTRSRKWQITINNPKKLGFTHDVLKERLHMFKGLVYWCMADEIGENGTYHTHVYMHCGQAVRFSTVKKRFEGAHFEMANGTAQQNKEYVFKEGKWLADKKADTNLRETHEEYGNCPIERQGARNDLADLYDMIKNGMSNYEIMEETSDYIFNMEKIEKVRQILREEKYKETFRQLETTYIFGETGTGKTRGVMEKYGYGNVFRVTDYSHPFDGYKGQDVVIFEEFRSSLQISDLLNYLDGYPLELPARYGNKIACFTKVFLITNIDLRDQYRKVQHEQPETFKALIRRIHEVHEYEGGQVIRTKGSEYMAADNWKAFRTNGEIENILNFAFYADAQKKSDNGEIVEL